MSSADLRFPPGRAPPITHVPYPEDVCVIEPRRVAPCRLGVLVSFGLAKFGWRGIEYSERLAATHTRGSGAGSVCNQRDEIQRLAGGRIAGCRWWPAGG
jgi:hypothetical protein